MGKLAKRLARRIQSLRGEESQRSFSQKLGIEQATLSRLERARENVTLATLEKLCKYFKRDVGWFFKL